jgi:genome maintenance exonuclease 1
VSELPLVAARRKSFGSQRLYDIEGKLYPSVTTILSVVGKPALVQWAKRVAIESVRAALDGVRELTRDQLDEVLDQALEEPERQRDAAATRGSSLHEEILRQVKETGYDEFGVLLRLGVSPLAAEYVLYSDRHCYAGTTDLVATTDGNGLVVIDWKSGGVWPEHALQIGAYRLALEEMTGRPVVAGYVVGLREGVPIVHQVDLELASAGFLSALGLYQALRDEGLLFAV